MECRGHQETDSVLVNYWYAHPVGHVIEGLRYCLGYSLANPTADISLILNGGAPVELASCVPFLREVYAVPYTDFLQPDGDPVLALADVPREWDWVVDNHREREPSHELITGFRAFFDASREHLLVRRGRGWTGGRPPNYQPNHQLCLELPEDPRVSAARRVGDRLAIAVVLAGHSDPRHFYPSVASWRLILSSLAERHPDAVFVLIGKLSAGQVRSTSSIAAAEVDAIAEGLPVIRAFDEPLLKQLALVEASQLFLSPHTGFGFAAVGVGTPWLTVSGGHWHEYFFNGVPFYSAIPDTRRYPCYTWGGPIPIVDDDDGEGPRIVAMSAARIREDLDDILHGADLLIRGQLSYEQALATHFPRLVTAYHGQSARAFSFDGVGDAYRGD